MCPNDTQPRRARCLYDDEAGSDVRFLVGPSDPGPPLRIPGHKSVLAKANPVFKAMFEGGFPVPPPPESIRITDVDGRAFENLLRFLYGHDVSLQSVTTAVLTLVVAYKYLCSELVSLCIAYLDEHIQVSTALEIFLYIRLYTRENHAPSAPPLEGDPLVMPSCDQLLHNTLHFIDRHADAVLEDENVESLDAEGLGSILGRDTLAVSSENVVFEALRRWSSHACKSLHLELTPENRKRVLGEDTVYLVRYLLMAREDFVRGPLQSGWLDPRASTAIISHLMHCPAHDMPKDLEEKWPALQRPRACGDLGLFPLSTRTGSLEEDSAKGKAKKGKCKRKKDKGKNGGTPSPDREKRSTGAKFVECLCGAIACILD